MMNEIYTHPLDVISFCKNRLDQEERDQEISKVGSGLTDQVGLRKALNNFDYVTVLRALWNERNPTKQIKWLRIKALKESHTPLIYELALQEYRAKPTIETINQISLPLIKFANFRLSQDIACVDNPALHEAIPLMDEIYMNRLDLLIFKFTRGSIKDLKEGDSTAMMSEVLKRIKSAIIRSDSFSLPFPNWIAFHGIQDSSEEPKLFPNETWAERRLDVAKGYIESPIFKEITKINKKPQKEVKTFHHNVNKIIGLNQQKNFHRKKAQSYQEKADHYARKAKQHQQKMFRNRKDAAFYKEKADKHVREAKLLKARDQDLSKNLFEKLFLEKDYATRYKMLQFIYPRQKKYIDPLCLGCYEIEPDFPLEGFRELSAIDLALENGDYKTISKAYASEKNYNKRLNWLRKKRNDYHYLLMFELALEEFIVNPTPQTFNLVSVPLISVANVRFLQFLKSEFPEELPDNVMTNSIKHYYEGELVFLAHLLIDMPAKEILLSVNSTDKINALSKAFEDLVAFSQNEDKQKLKVAKKHLKKFKEKHKLSRECL